MAEPQADKTQSLSEQYSLEKDKKPDMGSKPEGVKEVEIPVKDGEDKAGEIAVSTGESTEANSAPVEESTEANSAPVEESTESNSAPVEESTEANSAPAADDSTEAAPAATEESTEAVEEEKSADEEVVEETQETREIKLETAPADFRFPTTNQTRHCFTRYIEYHRCVAAKGEGATECDKFARYYRSLCPTEWVERWNEQRENGTFPGPL